MKLEIRSCFDKEIRAEAVEGEDQKKTIKGYAAVFEKYSQNFGGWVEKIAKGAFTESVQSKDVRALYSHKTDRVLGRTGNRSLRLWEDDYGLAFELDLIDTTDGRDTYENVRHGVITGVSFGFNVKREDQKWERGEGEQPHVRTLLKVELVEISPVAFPAYEQTSTSTRDAKALLEELELEWVKDGEIYKRQEGVEAWRPRV